MIVLHEDIDDSLVGRVVVQLSHVGENWYDRDPADRVPDRLAITAVLVEDDIRRLLFGQLRYTHPDGRVSVETEGAILSGADLEHGIGPGGWVEVTE